MPNRVPKFLIKNSIKFRQIESLFLTVLGLNAIILFFLLYTKVCIQYTGKSFNEIVRIAFT